MSMVFSVLSIVMIVLIGASLLTLLGIVLSLGHYDKKEVREKYHNKTGESALPECN